MSALEVVLPSHDARWHALAQLRRYLGELVFNRSGGEGNPPIAFKLPLSSIHQFAPDDVRDLPIPGIGFLDSRGDSETYGLGPPEPLDELTISQGLPDGSYLLNVGNYVEQVTIECWGSKYHEVMALKAGIETALRTDDSGSAVYLKIPDYYGLVAAFSLANSYYVTGPETMLGRRRAHVIVDMDICEIVQVVGQPLVNTYEIDWEIHENVDLTVST